MGERDGVAAGDGPGAGGAYLVPAICDLNGIFRGKRVPAQDLDKVLGAGLRMPLSSIGVDVWGSDAVGSGLTLEHGDTDGVCEATGRGLLPVLAGPGHLVPMWMRREDGTPFYSDARRMLAEILGRFDRAGLVPVVATELEFYLLDPAAPSAVPAGMGPGSPSGGADAIYSVPELDAAAPFLDEVFALARACGIWIDTVIAEGGPRQFELTLKHQPDALRAADDTVIAKQLIRTAAARHGHQACFMAKPHEGRSGSGLHVHLSLLDESGANVFDNGGPEGTGTLLSAIAGLIDSLCDLTLIFAPHANSYRRLVPGTLAPTTAAWGYENRTAAIRVPGGPAAARRLEHRVAGADANPYLVVAAILAGALDGIQRRATPPAPVTGNAYDQSAPALEPEWRAAVDRFARAGTAARLLHPELVHYLTACKRQELAVFAARIPAFELETYRAVI